MEQKLEEKKEAGTEEKEKDEGPVVVGRGNIYGNAKIPVKVLDGVIFFGIALIFLLILLELR